MGRTMMAIFVYSQLLIPILVCTLSRAFSGFRRTLRLSTPSEGLLRSSRRNFQFRKEVAVALWQLSGLRNPLVICLQRAEVTLPRLNLACLTGPQFTFAFRFAHQVELRALLVMVTCFVLDDGPVGVVSA